jgi:hypothetical protein
MRGKILIAVALAAAVGLTARSANACGQGGYGASVYAALGIGVLAVGALDVGLTLYDGGSAIASHRQSVGYGVLETLVAAPQLALGIAGLTSSNKSYSGSFAFYTVWMALLTTHGIWTIATVPRETTATVEGPEPRAALQRSAPEPVLQVGVGPTYVPLGQLSQPGFGLVGRF